MPIDLSPPVPAAPGEAIPVSRTPPRDVGALTGRHVLVMLIAFFAVIGVVNAAMMTLALRTMPGVAAKSAYEASQHFNRELAAIAAQDSLGWQVEIGATALEAGGRLGVAARDDAGQPLSGLSGEARLERPTDSQLDRSFALTAVGDGVYAAAVPRLAPGQWDLIVELRRDGVRQHLSRRRIVVRE